MNGASAAGNLACYPVLATGLFALGLAACASEPAPCDVIAAASLPPALREASGAAVDSAGRTWLLADSGEPLLFQVDDDGRVLQQLRVAGVRVEDWEDLAIGTCAEGQCFFIGEIGDNLHGREHREIIRVPVPWDSRETTRAAERLRFRYPDGSSDAEALVALPDGSLLVVTKGRNRAVGVYHYALPYSADSIRTLEHLQDLTAGIVQLPEQVTGGAAAGDRVVLRTYSAALEFEWTGDSLSVSTDRAPTDLRFLAEEQGEGVAIGTDGTLLLASEGEASGSFARLRCGALP